MGDLGTVTDSVRSLAERAIADHPPGETMCLALGAWTVSVETNSTELAKELRHYFRNFLSDDDARPADCRIVAIQTKEPDYGLEFCDWERDPGKVGRKDTFADGSDGRIVRKYRTGMQFLMGGAYRVAIGPCLANDNQVVNFVNSQFIGAMLNEGWVLCHAAAVANDAGRGLAMAGFSGGGKSTLALHLMSHGLHFTSNDRLLVRRGDGRIEMSGVPKFPRINPGTALNNPNLSSILPPDRRTALADMPITELWPTRRKIRRLDRRVLSGCTLRDSRTARRVSRVELESRIRRSHTYRARRHRRSARPAPGDHEIAGRVLRILGRTLAAGSNRDDRRTLPGGVRRARDI